MDPTRTSVLRSVNAWCCARSTLRNASLRHTMSSYTCLLPMRISKPQISLSTTGTSRRTLSSSTVTYVSSSLSNSATSTTQGTNTSGAPITADEYSSLSEHTLSLLHDEIEDTLLQTNLSVDDYEIDYFMGVLTVKLPYGTYVINKQPPNREIWLSSPVSGPKRFQYHRQRDLWYYPHSGDILEALLAKELTENLKCTFTLPPQGLATLAAAHD